MSIMLCSVLAGVEVPAEWVVGLGQGGRGSLEVSEGRLARHTCKERYTGQAVEGMQNPAEDSFGGDVDEVVQVFRGRLMFGQRSGRV